MTDKSDHHQFAVFKKGLKPELQTLLKLLKPQTLLKMIGVVLDMAPDVMAKIISDVISVEEHSSPFCRILANFVPRLCLRLRRIKNPDPSLQVLLWSLVHLSLILSASSKHKGRRHLSPAEYDERKKNKLCFRSYAPWVPNHKCPKSELQVLLLQHDCEVLLANNLVDEGLDEEILLQRQCCRLSLSVFLGANTPHTMKLRGVIGKAEVVVLIDSGATNNFLTPEAVKRLKLKSSCLPRCEVSLGNGVQNLRDCLPSVAMNMRLTSFMVLRL